MFQALYFFLIIQPVVKLPPHLGVIFNNRAIELGKYIKKAGAGGKNIDHFLVIFIFLQVIYRAHDGGCRGAVPPTRV